MLGDIKLFAGNSNPTLARAVANHLGRPLSRVKLGRFSDGEIHVEILETVRGQDCFILQSLSAPVNDHLMELLILVDALKRASAGQITALVPYYGYARQDRQTRPRTPITAKLVADLLTASGANRVIAMDLHAGQIQGFFSIPFDHLYAKPVLLDAVAEIQRAASAELVIVSPDAGGVERARTYSQRFNAPLAIIDKRRAKPNEAEVMNLIGDVKGRTAVIIDDMIDTAGTLTKAASAIMAQGAVEVHAVATHAVFSGEALSRIHASTLRSVVVTDSIEPRPAMLESDRIKVVSVDRILGEGIERVHGLRSLSSMFTTV